MNGKQAVKLIQQERHYLQTILKDFRPEHSDFKPTEEMRTVGQQIKHIALTMKFFYESVFGSGFNMNFQDYLAEMKNQLAKWVVSAQQNSDRTIGNRVIKPFDFRDGQLRLTVPKVEIHDIIVVEQK